MPKLIPVANPQTKPFWDAVNQKKFVIQKCDKGHLNYPPGQRCSARGCGSEKLEWSELPQPIKGHIDTYIVIEDGRLDRRIPDQPYNMALITLDEDPTINFYSNLPGIETYKVPVGAPVEMIFEETAPGTLIHEWKVTGPADPNRGRMRK